MFQSSPQDRYREGNFYRTQSQRLNARQRRREDSYDASSPWSCVRSAGVALFASIALSGARGASLSVLAGDKKGGSKQRLKLFRSGFAVSMKIYVPIFLVCTQFDCLEKMMNGSPRVRPARRTTLRCPFLTTNDSQRSNRERRTTTPSFLGRNAFIFLCYFVL